MCNAKVNILLQIRGMKYFAFIVLFVCCSFSSLFGQVKYDYSLNGTTHSAFSIEAKKPLFKRNYLQIDSVKIKNEEVEYFNNARGHFVNVKPLIWSPNARFAERIREGKINLYQEIDNLIPVAHSNPAINWNFLSSFVFANIRHFYSEGVDGPVKKFKYNEFATVISDNAEASRYLKKSKKIKNVQFAFYIASLTASVSSIALTTAGLLTDGDEGDDLLNTGTVISLSGLVGYTTTYLLNFGK